MLQIVNKGIFFSSFFQKRERKEKIKQLNLPKGVREWKWALEIPGGKERGGGGALQMPQNGNFLGISWVGGGRRAKKLLSLWGCGYFLELHNSRTLSKSAIKQFPKSQHIVVLPISEAYEVIIAQSYNHVPFLIHMGIHIRMSAWTCIPGFPWKPGNPAFAYQCSLLF